MFVFRKIWHALFFWNTRVEIRPFAFLPTNELNAIQKTYFYKFKFTIHQTFLQNSNIPPVWIVTLIMQRSTVCICYSMFEDHQKMPHHNSNTYSNAQQLNKVLLAFSLLLTSPSPTGINIFRVISKNTRPLNWMCAKLTVKTILVCLIPHFESI